MLLNKVLSKAIAILGIGTSLFFVATWPRIAVVAAFCCCIFAITRVYKQDSLEAFICNYGKHLFAIIFAIGVVLRVLIGFVYGYWSNPSQESDFLLLSNQAKEVASGIFPVSKSWTSIILYGFCFKVFANDLALVIFSHILDALSALIAYNLARKVFGKSCALLTLAMFWLSPDLAFHGFRVATEHPYVLFLLLALFLGANATQSNKSASLSLYSLGAAVSAIFAMWSRGEGILVVCAIPLVSLLSLLKSRKKLIIVECLFCAVCVCCGAIAWRINMSQGQEPTVFCSNDNYWPRLFGATVSTNGHFDKTERDAVLAKAGFDVAVLRDNPWATPPEVISLIKDETRNRWHDMSYMTMVRHVVGKVREAFCSSTIGLDSSNPKKAFVLMSFVSIWPAIASFAALCYFVVAWRALNNMDYYSSVVLLIMIGNMMIISITETSPRYGILIYSLWPFYAGVGLRTYLAQIRR